MGRGELDAVDDRRVDGVPVLVDEFERLSHLMA